MQANQTAKEVFDLFYKDNAFYQYMVETYSHNELADIANFGCQKGVKWLVFHSDTTELYDKFSYELHSRLSKYQKNLGEVPEPIIKALGEGRAQFCEMMVWFGAEVVAHSLTLGKYIQESKSA